MMIPVKGNKNYIFAIFNTWDPFYQHWLTKIPAWISDHMPSEVWDDITYLFPNFNGAAVEVWE